MMKLRFALELLAVVCLAALCSSCEQIVSADDLPYVNHIVVRGRLNAGQPIDSIYLAHTLPLSEQYDPARALLSDAEVSIAVDGVTYPLRYVDSGLYSPVTPITAQSGKTYHLEVHWNGLSAFSSTRVPFPAEIDSIRATDTTIDTIYFDSIKPITQVTYGLMIKLRPKPSEAYSWIDRYYNSGVLPNLITIADVDSTGEVSAIIFSHKYFDTDTSVVLPARITTYDEPYDDFVRSYRQSSDAGQIFGSGGVNPQWNVTGDGIGLFIGTATLTRSWP